MKKNLSIAFVIALVIACTDQSSDEDELYSLKQVKLENEMLSFINLDHFFKVKEILRSKDNTFLNAWEKELGFKSFRSEFLELSSDIESKKLNPHEVYEANKNIYASDDYTDLNLPNLEMSKVITPFGLTKIGDQYYSFSKDYLKIITDGDKAKIKLLSGLTTSNAEAKIFVSPVVRKQRSYVIDPKNNGKVAETQHSCSNQSLADNYKIIVIEDYTETHFGFTKMHKVYSVSVNSKRIAFPGYTTSDVLQLVGTSSTQYHGSFGTSGSGYYAYNTTIANITFMDILVPLTNPPFILTFGYWYGFIQKGSASLNCEISY